MISNPYEIILFNIERTKLCLSETIQKLEDPNAIITKIKNTMQSTLSDDMLSDVKEALKSSNLKYQQVTLIRDWFANVKRCKSDTAFDTTNLTPLLNSMSMLLHNSDIIAIEKNLHDSIKKAKSEAKLSHVNARNNAIGFKP